MYLAAGGKLGRAQGECEFACHDMRQLPREWEHEFDAVVDKGALCAAAFGGERSAAAALHECARVVRPGGALFFITEDPPELRAEMLLDHLGSGWSFPASVQLDHHSSDDSASNEAGESESWRVTPSSASGEARVGAKRQERDCIERPSDENLRRSDHAKGSRNMPSASERGDDEQHDRVYYMYAVNKQEPAR